ncbi:heterokaryon incompatibility protein-domain-containing protein [Xylaria palmicola]|nr:heterokaryon incompatibility protein-domain-containing protein [Xylaria palmicola]
MWPAPVRRWCMITRSLTHGPQRSHQPQLKKFDDDTKPIPPYAILSHTWGAEDEEISFQELQRGEMKKGPGQYKFDECCAQAARDGLSYAWIDTCCIDQMNSTELSEAINSMFKWYKDAKVCYAYLRDVKVDEDPLKPQSSFWKSRWFQRGWTLQELIAPAVVQFYDARWNYLGPKRDLSSALVQITRIPRVFLLGSIPLHEASVAQRMSWAAGRVTKRKEDLAYCLLGLFGITMPMIYGEGDQAFIRLQEEIARHINDDSILAWNFSSNNSGSRTGNNHAEFLSGGALATSPSDFADSSHIVPSGPKGGSSASLQMLGGSLLVRRRLHRDSSGQCFVVLQCQPDNQPERFIGIPVQARSGGYDDYVRLHGHPRRSPASDTTSWPATGRSR